MKQILLLIFSIFLSGCMTTYKPTIPPNYTGGVATLTDTYERQGKSSANYYYLSKINKDRVINAITRSNIASYNKGATLIAIGQSRQIPTENLSLTIKGQVHHSAPIGYMFNSGKNYEVEGVVEFKPMANMDYLIKGSLSDSYSAVWIEDIDGNKVSEVVRIGESQNEDSIVSSIDQKVADFLNLSGGETARLVKSKLGEPNSTSIIEGSRWTSSPDQLQYTYRDLGNIIFSGTLDNENDLYIDKTIPFVEVGKNEEEVIDIFSSQDGRALQVIAKSYYNDSSIDIATLDKMAGKVWEERNSSDNYMIDAMSWLCKTLGKSGNERYSFLLEEVSRKAKSKKLQKYAKKSLEFLPTRDGVQFKPAI